jgi:hypothetical protein
VTVMKVVGNKEGESSKAMVMVTRVTGERMMMVRKRAMVLKTRKAGKEEGNGKDGKSNSDGEEEGNGGWWMVFIL